jgi:hypothetical protein
MQELSTEDPKGFQNFLRMGKTDFHELLAKVTPHVQRQDTWMREAISAAERLSITLRYLATGDSCHSLEYLYRIPVSTLSTLIPETCQTSSFNFINTDTRDLSDFQFQLYQH